jgi:hypothetical protein
MEPISNILNSLSKGDFKMAAMQQIKDIDLFKLTVDTWNDATTFI